MNAPLLRIKTSLQEHIQDLLNKQIAMEAHSCAIYLAMSAWCSVHGLQESAKFYRKQSGEEREHMLRIFDYVAEVGGYAISPQVTNVPQTFDNLFDVLSKSLEQEIKITESFNYMTDECHKAKDYQTAKFLQWFLNEQLEEEKTARRAIEIYELIGTEGDALFKIDHQIGKLAEE